MSQRGQQIFGYGFEDFILDLHNRQVIKSGKPVPLNSKYFDVLVLLIRNSGRLCTKQYIFDHIWGDVIVTDWALSQCIKDIRKVLGDNFSDPKYIKTVPKHGFTFLCDVREITAEINENLHRPTAKKQSPRPYKFLDYYTEQDENLYFGREKEIELLYSKILNHRTAIIHGRSGVGKSSIVRAGLIPQLKKSGHSAFVIRVFSDPLNEMINALQSLHKSAQKDVRSEDLLTLLSRRRKREPDTNVVLFFDQFEEFFQLLSHYRQSAFIQSLGDVISPDESPVKLVFVLREDLLAEMSRLKAVIPDIFHNEWRLTRLDRDQGQRVILEPAKIVGCPFEKELAERIVDELSGGEDIDPPQLQIVCDTLYDERDTVRGISLAQYERMGGASKILADYLARVLTRFPATDLITVKYILKSLISVDKGRRIMLASEIKKRLEVSSEKEAGAIDNLIEELVRSRIIRFRQQDGRRWIELSHDFIVPEISGWLTDEDRSLKQAEILIQRAVDNYISHELLMSGETLDLILPFGDQLTLNAEEVELFTRSMLYRERVVPAWLARLTPSLKALINEAADHEESSIRLNAVRSCAMVKNQKLFLLLQKLALWDREPSVRKAASITLVEQYGAEGVKSITDSSDAGFIRRVICLAFARDRAKNLVSLSSLPLPVAMAVLIGLIWVRIARNRRNISRRVGGGTLGGSLAGLSVGLLLASAMTLMYHPGLSEATSDFLVLMSLGLLAGAFSGFGVSLGITAVQNIAYRHSHWWTVGGGAIGGAAIGGVVNFLGLDILRALFGQELSGITGAFEGLIMGIGLASGLALAERNSTTGVWRKILFAALGAMCSAIILTSIQGNLFSGSIDIIARSFSQSQLNLQKISAVNGETMFSRFSRIVLGGLEGLLFGSFTTAGMVFFRGTSAEKGS